MKKILIISLTFLFVVAGLSLISLAEDCPIITLHYNERVPYLVTTPDGTVEGLTATPAKIAFERAGINFKWKKTPSKRQMLLLERNSGCDCAVGWFKNPQREQFARYSIPIYRDNPQIAITRADNSSLQDGMTVDELFSQKTLLMGKKDGYSYGSFLDKKIALHNPTVDVTVGENDQMLKKVDSKRNDYFFMSPEEAEGLIASSGFQRKQFKIIIFPDMPIGEYRYILCSQKVDNSVIDKLNANILTITGK